MQHSFLQSAETPRDFWLTPDWCATDILEWFKPSGVVLDPCRGPGAFHRLLPDGSPWCEISEGRDFFQWSEPVDWCVGNPPYSLTRRWLNHSFEVAANVLYLLPLRNVFSAFGMMREIYDYGGIAAIRAYGTGNFVGFPMGNAVGAMHFRREYTGPIEVSFWGSSGSA